LQPQRSLVASERSIDCQSGLRRVPLLGAVHSMG
jgi:hypothetical protein